MRSCLERQQLGNKGAVNGSSSWSQCSVMGDANVRGDVFRDENVKYLLYVQYNVSVGMPSTGHIANYISNSFSSSHKFILQLAPES
jgi:hypothetical protein